jgi:hypothetical protein
MAANKEGRIADEVVDQLLEGRDPATVFESGGLVDELKKRLADRSMRMRSGAMRTGPSRRAIRATCSSCAKVCAEAFIVRGSRAQSRDQRFAHPHYPPAATSSASRPPRSTPSNGYCAESA